MALIVRTHVNSMKAARAIVREYLNELKGLMRINGPDDWILGVR